MNSLIALLTQAGVPHEVRPRDDGGTDVIVQNWMDESRDDIRETIGFGYGGFYSAWRFDASGKLVCVAHLE